MICTQTLLSQLEEKYGIKVLAVQADVNSGADNEAVISNVIKQTIDEFGRIDVLINKSFSYKWINII